MKIAQISAIIGLASATVAEGYPCVLDTDCTTANSSCCNAYRAGNINKKICFTTGSTELPSTNTPSPYCTKNCAVAATSAVQVGVQAVVSALTVMYMT